MTASVLREKVIEEIQQIPEEKLIEVYDFIHFFRIGFQTSRHVPKTQEILNAVNNIYGLWEDREMNVDEYIRDLRKDRSYDHVLMKRLGRKLEIFSEPIANPIMSPLLML